MGQICAKLFSDPINLSQGRGSDNTGLSGTGGGAGPRVVGTVWGLAGVMGSKRHPDMESDGLPFELLHDTTGQVSR